MMLIRRQNMVLLVLSLLAALLHFIQLAFVNKHLAVGENVPDLLLLLIVFVGFRLGSIAGSTLGFAAGLLQDLVIDFYGLHALCKTVVGFVSPYFAGRRVLLVERFYLPLVTFAMSILHDLLWYPLQTLGTPLDVFSLWARLALPNAVYNTVLMFVILMMLPERATDAVRESPR